jgi:hypothetical protein
MGYWQPRTCENCGCKSIFNKICLQDKQKRPIKMEKGYRPDWCPIDDEDFKKEKWERKTV